MEEFGIIPDGWELVDFETSFDAISDNGNRVKRSEYLAEGKFPVVDQGEEFIGGYTNAEEFLIEKPLPIIVFGDHTRRFKYLTIPFAPGADGVKLLSPSSIWNPKFIFYQLLNTEIEDKGYSRHYQILRKEKFKLAPENEQSRIVEKLEELLSDLDDGVAELKAAQAKLRQYRQSLLKSAVEGSLTAEWRAENKPTETGEQLLKRILTERRKRWEMQKLAEFKEKGQKPPKDWQKKYPEPVAPDTSELPELPEGWVWVTLSCVSQSIQTGPFGSLLHREDYVVGGTPLVNPTHISNQEIVPDLNLTVGAEKLRELEGFKMSQGDIVIGRRGEMGRCAVITAKEEGWLCGTGSLFVRLLKDINPFFISWCLSSKAAKDYLSDFSVGTTMQNLNQKILQSTPIPLCSMAEQDKVIEFYRRESQDAKLQEQYIVDALKATFAQRKNFLRDAFCGKLVDQNPSDEPASILLAKIKAARAGRELKKKPKEKKGLKVMKNLDVNLLKKIVADLDRDQFTYSDLADAVTADYESLRSALFATLSESRPIIFQHFDEELQQIIFKKSIL